MTPRRAQKLMRTLATGRLTLEPLVRDHAECLFSLLADPRTQVWIPPPRCASVAELRAHWASNESRCEPEGIEALLAWAIRRVDDGAYVGKIDANVSDTRWATNLGYVLGREAWGRGYATEAVNAVVGHLFAAGIHGCHAYVRPGNDASCRVLLRAGFDPAGTLLDELKFTLRATGPRPTRG